MPIMSFVGAIVRLALSIPQMLIFLVTVPILLTTTFKTVNRFFNLILFSYRFISMLYDCGIDPLTLMDRINKVQECLEVVKTLQRKVEEYVDLVKKMQNKIEHLKKLPLDVINTDGSRVNNALTGVDNKLPGSLKPNGSGIHNGLTEVANNLPTTFNPNGSGVQNILTEVTDKFPETLNPIGSSFKNGLLDMSCEMTETLRSHVPNLLLNVAPEVSLSSMLGSSKGPPPPPPPPSVENFKFTSTPNPVFMSRADYLDPKSLESTEGASIDSTRCKKQRLFNEDLIQQRKLLRKITKNSTPVSLQRALSMDATEKSTEREQSANGDDESLGEILKSALKRKFANVNDMSSINESISLSQDFSI